MKSQRLQRMAVTSVSSLLAVFVALCICAVILLITGKDPIEAYRTLFGAAGDTKVLQGALNRATPLMISAAAVAIGFKMNLFNIGVEGQMRVALLATAVAGAAVDLPAPLHILFCLVVAMATGVPGCASCSTAATFTPFFVACLKRKKSPLGVRSSNNGPAT